MNDGNSSRGRNLAYAALAGQAGCVTILFVFVALFVGLWLDARFGLRGPFTIGLLLLSIPLCLLAMLRIALGAIKEIQPPTGQPRKKTSHKEEG